MRRIVRDRVVTSVQQAKGELEEYIARCLQYPEAFPYALRDPPALVREIRALKITPRFRADYPVLEILVTMRASVVAEAKRRDDELGPRNFDIDLELHAVAPSEATAPYDIAPQWAKVEAWWSG